MAWIWLLRSYRSSASNVIVASFSSMFCWWFSFTGVHTECTLLIWYFWVIFRVAVVPYDVCSFWCYCIMFKCFTHFPGTCPVFFIDDHNALFYCIKDKWLDRRHLYFLVFRPEKCLYPVIRYKKTHASCPQFFCFFFLVFRNTSIPPSWWMPSNG